MVRHVRPSRPSANSLVLPAGSHGRARNGGDAMTIRDMSKQQYLDALARNGFTSEGFMGYYDLGIPNQKIAVSVINAGASRRARLAYLLRERDKHLKELGLE
jgi:hypothetical protein